MHCTTGVYTSPTAVSRQQSRATCQTVFRLVRPARHVCRAAPRSKTSRLQEKNVEELAQVAGQDPKEALPAYKTEEGYLVCDRIQPGNYTVHTAAPRQHADQIPESKLCCGVDDGDCISYCYVLDNGQLICEGVPPGEYSVKPATETHVHKLLDHFKSLGTEEDEHASQDDPGAVGSLLGKILGGLRGS